MKNKILTFLMLSLCLTLSAEAKPHKPHHNHNHSNHISCHHKIMPHYTHHHCHPRLGISFTSGAYRYYNPIYGYNPYVVTPFGYYSYPVGGINSPNLHINVGL